MSDDKWKEAVASLPMAVRKATPEDSEEICAVLRRSIVELCRLDHGDDPELIGRWLANKTSENVRAWISDPANTVLVACKSNRVIGVAAMINSGRITLNYVSPDHRFHGVSKSLLLGLETEGKKLGLTKLTLSSTRTALRFYRAAGFLEDHPREAPEGNLAMSKFLGDEGSDSF